LADIMKKLIIIIFLLPLISFSKEKPPAFIAKIIASKSPVLIYSFQSALPTMPILEITDLQKAFQYTGQALTKNSKGLFLNHLGTGRVYKWLGDSQEGYWQRTDSTFYTGYNFLSVLFSVDSSIYSFGGLGFWYQNGNLRKFNFEAKEWNAKLLNRSIPWFKTTDAFFYIDTLNKDLYFNGIGRYHDASLKDYIDSSTLDKIYKINLSNETLSELGKFIGEKGSFVVQTPWGILTSKEKIIDLVNNQIYKLSDNVINNLLRVVKNSTNKSFAWEYTFWMDSAVYFANSKEGFDSIIIHKSDLIPMNQPAYSPETLQPDEINNKQKLFIWGSIILLLITTNLFALKKYLNEKKRNKLIQSESTSVLNYPTKKYIEINEIEKGLLKLIFTDSISNRLTSISAINNILGCNNKSIEIQKRLRSDVINSLNEKLAAFIRTEKVIINRKRTEFDGRSFEYFIDPIHFEAIESLLKD
jgi:hypothetical protein